MDQPDYEYRGLMAQTWDLFRGDTSKWPDRELFHELILIYGQPVMDVGCGTGRLLLDYLAQGIDIEGVDLSPEMLALCREKAQALGLNPTLYQQAMEDLNLPRTYRVILVPSSSMQLVLDPALTAQAMRRLFAQLESGGVLVMPFMRLWQPGDPLENDWHLTGEAIRPEDGLLARRWSRSSFDPATELEHTEDRYELLRANEIIASEHHRRSPATRSYTQQQAIDLYQAAGFINIELRRQFSPQPADPDDTLFSVIGQKP
jgi:SAM-dependent methyltransferase